MHSRLNATAVRHLGPRAAVEAARMATSGYSNMLVGFGLTGDEHEYQVEFAEAFRIVRGKRIADLKQSGDLLRRAEEIRALVARVKVAVQQGSELVPREQLARWGALSAFRGRQVGSGSIGSGCRRTWMCRRSTMPTRDDEFWAGSEGGFVIAIFAKRTPDPPK